MRSLDQSDQFFDNLLSSRKHRTSTLTLPTQPNVEPSATQHSASTHTSSLRSGVFVQGKPVSALMNSDVNTTTDSRRLSRDALLRIYDYTFPEAGIILAVGSPSSGVSSLLDENSPDVFRLRGGQFATDETYNSVVGASAGYVGSDKSTSFITFLNEKKRGTIIIDGVENGSAALLSDFVSMAKAKTFVDKSGNIPGAIDVSNFQFVFILHERIQSKTTLSSAVLNEKLYKLIKADRSPMVPPELIEAASVYHFYDFLDQPDKIPTQLAQALGSASPVKLKDAALKFFLTNTELFEIGAAAVRIQSTDSHNILLYDDAEFMRQRIFSKADYAAFQDELDSYFGQDEAAASFSDALALKVQNHLPRPTSLFCVGPPGIGKTEIAKRLGKSVDSFVRIDGNVIQSSADLFGSERGPGQLTQKLTKGAPAVILFDEAEKMDRATVLSLLQLLDEGLISDQFTKETWPLQEALIVFTSNAIKDPNITALDARSQLTDIFPQEFVDRLDFIVPFRYFSDEHRKQIAATFAEAASLTLTDTELQQVARSQSIRQIQLDVQRIAAAQAATRLDRELGRSRGR